MRYTMRRFIASFVAAAVLTFSGLVADTHGQKNSSAGSAGAPVRVSLPLKDGSVRFMVVGDTGTGGKQQYELAAVMLRYWQSFPFEFALFFFNDTETTEKAAD